MQQLSSLFLLLKRFAYAKRSKPVAVAEGMVNSSRGRHTGQPGTILGFSLNYAERLSLFFSLQRQAYLVNESKVVGHQHQASLEAFDGLSQGINGLNVQMVGGLIQQQQVGVLHADHAEHNAAFLPITQLADLGGLHASCNQARL